MKAPGHLVARWSIGALLAAVALVVPMSGGSAASSYVTTVNGFVNYELGVGVNERCPNSASACQNHAAEPAIRADRAGNFYGSSENGLTSGTEAWKSTDGGLHFTHLASPNILSRVSSGPEGSISPAGGDTDLATASVRNSAGFFNVYVASLEGTSTDVSTSPDGGKSWRQNLAAGTFPGEDREWIAADGASKVCISYVSAAGILITPLGLHVECSYDAGLTFTQIGDAITTGNLDSRLGFKIGNLAIDQGSNTGDPSRKNDIVYAIYASGTAQDAIDPNPTDFHVVWMGVSLDGGRTFNDYQVYNNPNPKVGYAHNFTNVAVDRAGNVYSFFSDNHFVYYKYSTDHGKTWLPGGPSGAPIVVSKAPANTAIFPWGVAGAAGKVDLVYYGTSYYDGVNPPDSYPASAAWNVYFAQNLNAIGAPASWTQKVVSPINHFGAVCEGGAGCTGNRDLYDDFGVAARPGTGLATIIYSDDQYDQVNPAVSPPPDPLFGPCTPARSNGSLCNHTSIAAQTSGPGIN
jgi:hypothetical protein